MTAASAPAVASARALLRDQLPGVFATEAALARQTRRGPAAAAVLDPHALVGALEEVLDPILAVLEGLDGHLDPATAPEAALELLAAWLGERLPEMWEAPQRRRAVREAARAATTRGTRSGLEAALAVAFPKLGLRVVDEGGIHVGRGSAGSHPPDRRFSVLCDTPLETTEKSSIVRLVDELKPAGTAARLRVRSHGRGEPS